MKLKGCLRTRKWINMFDQDHKTIVLISSKRTIEDILMPVHQQPDQLNQEFHSMNKKNNAMIVKP